MNNKTLLLVLAAVLIVVGITKPNVENLVGPKPVVNVLELVSPTDETIKAKADIVVDIAKTMDEYDARRLRDLCLDLATLIKIDGEDTVIKNTEEVRQANSLSGVMLKLDIKGRYKDLAVTSNDVIKAAIGDDNIPLTPDLRNKAVDGFNALAWAYNGGK